MDNGLIPHRYAKALFKYASETGKTEEMYNLMKHVISSFRDNPDLRKVLSNPFVSSSDKEKLMLSAAGNEADEAYTRFVKLIIGHNRAGFAYEIMLAYRDIYRKENDIMQVNVTTAVTLPEAQMQKLQDLVRNAFKGSVLEFSESVNPDLIGGFVIDVDSVRMDASVSSELEKLRQTLLRSN
ncbi:MAG: F0F1 ATP synthase subunit delta [Muribaculaceae bacterium]|nr:F0F1 ATP synthase subunit delta [Muribaculaceae bacterium]